jgi:hypothetical protein
MTSTTFAGTRLGPVASGDKLLACDRGLDRGDASRLAGVVLDPSAALAIRTFNLGTASDRHVT